MPMIAAGWFMSATEPNQSWVLHLVYDVVSAVTTDNLRLGGRHDEIDLV
jgi:hypothetical protein